MEPARTLRTNRLFSKLWAPFDYGLYCGTEYLGVPKWDLNFRNYPDGDYRKRCQGFQFMVAAAEARKLPLFRRDRDASNNKGIISGLYRDNGKENGNCYIIIG